VAKIRYFSVLVFALVTVIGCGVSKTPLSGKVTMNGKPVVWGNVTLITSDGMSHYAELQIDGTFKTVDSVAVGPVKIGVTSSKPVVAAAPPKQEAGVKNNEMAGLTRGDRGKKATEEQAKAWFPIPEKFADPNSSGLSDTISSGKPLNVELK
jgi:hypothetical protein